MAIRGIPRKEHLVTVGARKFLVELPDVYDAITNNTGVQEATDANRADALSYTVSGLLYSGMVAKLTVSYRENNKRKTAEIIVAIDKLQSAITGLKGKSFAGSTIIKAYSPHRATTH